MLLYSLNSTAAARKSGAVTQGPKFSVYNFRVRSVIILFAKAPIPGHAKTRLMPALSAEQAANLHEVFVADTIELLQSFENASIELHTDIRTDAWREFPVTRDTQVEGSLELKMVHALSSAHARGFERAMILGSDSPTLPEAYIHALLDAPEEVTLGPTDDGGYWGVAASRSEAAMFRNVRWSTAEALADTVRALREAGLTVGLGPQWYDIDEPADLERLQRATHLPRRTRAWFKRTLSSASTGKESDAR